jgi:hypothetical protein
LSAQATGRTGLLSVALQNRPDPLAPKTDPDLLFWIGSEDQFKNPVA